MANILNEVVSRFTDLELEETVAITKKALLNGVTAHTILTQGLTKGMEGVGKLFESGEYFLADLMTSTYIMEQAMKVIEEQLRAEVGEAMIRGKVVFGTVKGDLHTIGKDITICLLRASGYEVFDLGIDVSTEAFIEKVKEAHPDIVAMSSLLLTTLPSMAEVVKALKSEGLRDDVFIMIGGATTTQNFADKIGADAYCATALEGVNKANQYTKGKKRGEGEL
jgi:methanogenic corrinoid protein MtbC1